jgi:hypothetical protein
MKVDVVLELSVEEVQVELGVLGGRSRMQRARPNGSSILPTPIVGREIVSIA